MAKKTNSTETKEINYIPLIENYFYSADENNYILYYFNSREKNGYDNKKINRGDIRDI